MEYLTVKETAEKWGVSGRRVSLLCNEGRIEGAEKKGLMWLIPKDAEKPIDMRCSKKQMDREK
ncbi:MAG: helix-turn-helix domain-containing protein [Lachnospiraceae bacterium]|nr:helix-turn-helix domain-containing protein [Lachnospiraceae bacterium]